MSVTPGRDDARRSGRVILVGAGPGDPELITVRGLRRIRAADVVVYDRLVHSELLAEAPPEAERIFVGKAARLAVRSQREIHAILIARARAGRTVVRLKGGDPFVFGRGGEEVEALSAAGIPWEVVPAVSSAVGAPAAAGIPVTHRSCASSLAVVTGHGAPGSRQQVDWAGAARMDTVVVLMGLARLPEICRVLGEHGRGADTPVAVIERGTLPEARTVISTLAAAPEAVRDAGLRSPATIVIGDVVRRRRVPERAAPGLPARAPCAAPRAGLEVPAAARPTLGPGAETRATDSKARGASERA